MKELNFREETKEKYVEDILDTDLVGLETTVDEKVLIVFNGIEYIGLSNRDNKSTIFSKWSAKSKLKYIKDFNPKPKVLLFENEAEMLTWYNNK